MAMYRLILAEDHILVREGIKRLIESHPGFQVVAEASDGPALMEFLRKNEADMAIIDISLPGVSGIELTREVKRRYPGLKVMILTMHKKREYLQDAISAGAEGYLLKEDAPTALMEGIKNIRQGEIYVSSLLSAELAQLYAQSRREFPEAAGEEPLTPREIEIIKLIAEGKSSREIAEVLFLSFRTIQNHRSNIMKKLNINKTVDLVKYAFRRGYVTPPP
jgi:DNA-binding NarL/FixJ family response regulator